MLLHEHPADGKHRHHRYILPQYRIDSGFEPRVPKY